MTSFKIHFSLECLYVHYEKWDGVHGVLVHDIKGEQNSGQLR